LFIETIVEPNQKNYNYYHEQLRRVPTVDQCYDDDRLCKWEANQQLIRDKYVSSISFCSTAWVKPPKF